ncbi:hypothetical protein DESA109040_05870 [Deinococcus saxicola]|uniref:phage tail tape measure protein n=1 Tax=Deinococcus saxicola TaxID=249406 RepID=UPI0039F090C3
MTQATRSVTYTLASRTTGVPGLEKFGQALERIRAVQDQIKRQGDVVAGLRDKTATVRLKFETASINAELARIQNRSVNINIKFGNMQTVQNDVKTFKNLLASVGTNMQYTVTVKTTALSLLNTQFDLQIVKLQSLISQLRALGNAGGAGGGRGGAGAGSISAANRALLGELDALNNKWQRGDILAADFGRELTALQAKLRTAAAGATAGSAEFARLDTGLTRLTTSLRSINTDAFQKLRTDAGAMRAAFDSATAGVARNSSQFQAAAGSYSAASAQIIARLQALSSSGRLTTTQLGQVNRELQRLAREANTIGGSINHAGLSGSVVNSFGMLGGQFGALAFQGVAVVTMFRSIQAAAGGAGLALGAIAAGVLVIGGAFVSLGATGLREIQKTQHGLNVLQANGVKDLGAMEQSVSNLKTALGGVGDSFAKSDLTESLADTVKAGLSADDSLTLMATSAKLAAAENINLNDATGLLLKNIRQYGGTVLDAAKTGDYLAKSGNLAAGTANDLSVGLGIVAGTGKQAKIEMYNLLGMLVELDNKGMNAADVGANGLRAAIAALGDPTEKARGILKGLKIETEDLNGKARPAGDIMVELGEKLRGMGIVADKTTGELSGNGEALRVVSGIMDNRAAAAVINLTGEWRTYGAEIKDSRGELNNYSTILQQGLAPALKGLKTAWADAGGTFVKSFAGPMTEFLGTLTQTVKELDKLLGLAGDAKDAREIQLSLKINASDDLTTMIMKFLMGTGQGLKEGLSIPVVPSQELIDAAVERQRLRGGSSGPARATMVRNDLVRNGLLPQLTGAADRAQYEEIRNNVPKYEKLWDDFIDAAVKKAQTGGALLNGPKAAAGPFVGEGPLLPGQVRAAKAGQQFSYDFISTLGEVFKRDPRVGSDCAIIAYEILNQLGAKIKGSAKDNAWVPNLEQNAIKSGFVQVKAGEVRPGDLVIFKGPQFSPNGSKMHAGVSAGYKDGNLMVTDNPGTLADGKTDGITRTRTIGGDAPFATFYRAPNSPYVLGAPAAQPSGSATAAAIKTFDAYMNEARRILGQIEKFSPQGSAPDGQKWAKATAYLKTFADQNDVAGQALAYVQLETKKADKTTSQYGQTFDRLKGKLDITQSLENLGRPAGEITKQLSAIGTSASQAAEAERKRNGETAKYRALLDLAGDAAKRLKTIQDRKPEQTPVQREQAALAELRSAQAQERAFRAAGTQRLSNIIKGGVQKEGDLDRVKGAESELKRRADLDTEAGKQAKKALEDNAALIGKLAEETAKAAVERSKEQAQLRAKYASERRNLDVQEAEADLARTQDLNRKELADFKGTAAQRVGLIKRQAQDEFNATEQVARAGRDRSIREFQNAGGPNQGRNIDGAKQAYKDAVSKAQNIQAAAGTLATEEQSKAVREARDGYSKLADSMREKIATGKVELSDLTAYRMGMDQAAEAAEKGGVAQTKYIKGPRASAEALYQAGIDAQIAAGMFADLGDGQSLAAEAGKSYAVSLEDALAAMPGTIEGNADYLKLLQDMAAAGQISGTVVAHISDLMRDQAIDAQIAAGAYADVADSYDRAARAGQGYVATQQDALDQIPGSTEANAAYLKVLQDLESAGKIAPGTVEAVSQSIRDQEVILANTAAWMERLTTEAGKTSDALVELGDTDGAMRTLQEALDEAWAASNRGEDAADTISDLTDKINALAKSTALSEGFNLFFSGLSGTIEDQISQVVDQLDHVTDPAMVARLKALLAELRQGVAAYEDPSKAGYAPGSNGGGFTNTQTGGAETARAIAAARDLTPALNTELDPATLGVAMTQAADLLASEVGQLLPPATKKGLEEGLANAKGYQDALADITAEAILDGHNRAASATTLPDNRFKEFSDQIMGGAFDLSNSEVLRGLYEGLDLSVKNGELTVAQLEIIKILIDSINASPVDVLPDAERWQQVDEWNDKLGKLEANLESGASTQDEFTASALEALPALEQLAGAAEKQGKTDLAAAWRAAAAGVRQLGGEALEAAEKLSKLQATATGLESIGNGLSSIFNAFGLGNVGKLSSALGGVFKAGLNIQSSYKAIGPAFQKSFGAGLSAVGSFLGPVGEGINLVGQIGQAIMDLSPGFQAWKKDLLEVAEIQKKALGAGTGGFESPWAKQLQEDAAKREKLGNAGFWQQVWWGLTGSAPQVMKTESAKLLAELQTIFAGLGEGISNSLTSSMTDAFLKGDMADFAANFEKSFDQVVGKVVLQTMIEAAVQEGAVAQDLGELTQATKDRRYNDIPSILARIKQHAGEAMAPIAALAPSLPGYGSGGGSGSSGGSEPTISPVDKRRRDELLYRYENAIDPAEKERLRKELLGLDPSSGGGGGTSTTVTLSPVKTETPDWAALNAGINRLVDFGALSDQIARMESETARMNRESAGVMAQAAGMMLLASQGRGSGAGPGNINF